jgi:hypothetical protein
MILQELIEEITHAFENVPYPGNSNIGTDSLIVTFHDLHWRDVSPEILFLHRFEITSFSPEAFRFYLPAMMLGALLHHEETDTLSETLVYRLGKSEDETLSDSHWGRKLTQIIELLSLSEKNTIYRFLLKCKELCPEWAWGEYQEAEVEDAIRFWETLANAT